MNGNKDLSEWSSCKIIEKKEKINSWFALLLLWIILQCLVCCDYSHYSARTIPMHSTMIRWAQGTNSDGILNEVSLLKWISLCISDCSIVEYYLLLFLFCACSQFISIQLVVNYSYVRLPCLCTIDTVGRLIEFPAAVEIDCHIVFMAKPIDIVPHSGLNSCACIKLTFRKCQTMRTNRIKCCIIHGK